MSVFLYGLAVVCLFLADPGRAPQVATGEKCPAIDRPSPALRVFVDPRTRTIRPPEAGETVKLFAVPVRDSWAYPVVVLPDGTKIVDLDDAFMNYVTVQRASDGSARWHCVSPGSDAAGRPSP